MQLLWASERVHIAQQFSWTVRVHAAAQGTDFAKGIDSGQGITQHNARFHTGIFPVSVLNAIKAVPEVCRVYCATVSAAGNVLLYIRQRQIVGAAEVFIMHVRGARGLPFLLHHGEDADQRHAACAAAHDSAAVKSLLYDRAHHSASHTLINTPGQPCERDCSQAGPRAPRHPGRGGRAVPRGL